MSLMSDDQKVGPEAEVNVFIYTQTTTLYTRCWELVTMLGTPFGRAFTRVY